MEDVADLDAARLHEIGAERGLLTRIVFLVGRRIEAGPGIHSRLQVSCVIDVLGRGLFQKRLVAEHRALAGVGQDDELV